MKKFPTEPKFSTIWKNELLSSLIISRLQLTILSARLFFYTLISVLISESFQEEFQKDKMTTDLANDVNMQTYNAYLGIVVEKSNQFQVISSFRNRNKKLFRLHTTQRWHRSTLSRRKFNKTVLDRVFTLVMTSTPSSPDTNRYA